MKNTYKFANSFPKATDEENNLNSLTRDTFS